MKNKRTLLGASLLITAALAFGACSSHAADTTVAEAPVETTMDADTAAADTAAAETTAADTVAADTAAETTQVAAPAVDTMGAFGAGCAAVPADGAGSFAGMAQDPAATAASNNPALSTLVAAVQAAGLVDTLNGAGPFTIFAPTNDAFAKIDPATIKTLLADPTGDLTKILTFHVIPGKALKAADLLTAGSEATVQGGSVAITGSGQDVTVNGTSKVVCGDVPVANGIVHIIDTVMLPA
jgi:uncharacterized surface protein with fasciclin (FAS1) repeats